jgi:hypothetical protein
MRPDAGFVRAYVTYVRPVRHRKLNSILDKHFSVALKNAGRPAGPPRSVGRPDAVRCNRLDAGVGAATVRLPRNCRLSRLPLGVNSANMATVPRTRCSRLAAHDSHNIYIHSGAVWIR